MSDKPKPAFTPNPALAWIAGPLVLIIPCDSLAQGLIMGTGAAFTTLMLFAAIRPARSFLPERLAFPVSLAVLASLAAVYSSAVRAFAPATAADLGIYLYLLAVNPLGLHTIRRCAGAAAADSRRPAGRFASVLGESAGLLAACALIGALRELAGTGSLTLPAPEPSVARIALLPSAPLPILATPAGAFILLGVLVAAYRATLRVAGRRMT